MPTADENRVVDAGAIERLLIGEGPGLGDAVQPDDVQAAGMFFAVVAQGRAAGEQAVGVSVHEGPMRFDMALEQRADIRSVAAIEHEIHRGRRVSHRRGRGRGDPRAAPQAFHRWRA